MKDKAVRYFRGKEKYKCTQAIMKVFCRYCTQSDISRFRKPGHGKANGGLCDAVYASNKLLSNNKEKKILLEKNSAKTQVRQNAGRY